MSSTAELTLGRSSNIVKSVAFAAEQLERMRRLEQYLEALEDERKKVEAFKRELPFCLQLLSHAIQASKEQLADCQQPPLKRQVIVHRCFEEDSNMRKSNGMPILEEFIPLKNQPDSSTFDNRRENRVSDHASVGKSNGSIHTKFWSQAQAYSHGEEMILSMTEKPFKKRENLRHGQEQSVAKPILPSQRRVGGAFLPFSRDRQPLSACRAGSAELPDLSLPFEDGEDCPHGEFGGFSISHRCESSEGAVRQSKDTPNVVVSNSSGQECSPPQRKARRCWSPELHRRFVNALQQLGGSQVATPKQIRELMKVDGLTNDEVKSHLQKYRLHTRRPPNAGFQSAAPHAPQLVVLGGIWVPPEYAVHAAAQQPPPSLYCPAQQAPHSHQPLSPDHYIQLNTSQLQLRPSLYYDDQQQEAPATHDHSQGSSRAGPLQLTGHSSDAGKEESLEEDANEGSSWKGEYQEERIQEAEEHGDSYEGSLRAHKWRYGRDSGEDDSGAEDNREYEIGV